MSQESKRSLIFLLLKVLVLQTFFYLTSEYGPRGNGSYFFLIGLLMMTINFIFVRRIINLVPYIGLTVLFFVSGFLLDTLLIKLEILRLETQYPPIWFPTLWMIFLAYYGDVFRKMLEFPVWLMSLLGAIGGTLAYYRGLTNVDVQLAPSFYPIIAIVWAVFMPFSLILFRYYRDKKKGAE